MLYGMVTEPSALFALMSTVGKLLWETEMRAVSSADRLFLSTLTLAVYVPGFG